MTIDQIIRQLRAEVQAGTATAAELKFEVTKTHVLVQVSAWTPTKRHTQAVAAEEEVLQTAIVAELETRSLQLIANVRAVLKAGE